MPFPKRYGNLCRVIQTSWVTGFKSSLDMTKHVGKAPGILDAPGVCFYQRESLPGYSAIFRHPNDELNFCYYLIPCGKDGMCGDVSVKH